MCIRDSYNWEDYIDETVLDDFQAEHPEIKVNYERFSTNEDMYNKLSKSNTKYDVLFPADYMIEKMIDEGMLAKLDFSNIPNYQYSDEKFKNLDYDPNNEDSVPYMWGDVYKRQVKRSKPRRVILHRKQLLGIEFDRIGKEIPLGIRIASQDI